MNQKQLSVMAECGLILIAMQNETIDRDLILQYYTEEQLEWYAKSEMKDQDLNLMTLESLHQEWKEYVDTYTGKLEPYIVRIKRRAAEVGLYGDWL